MTEQAFLGGAPLKETGAKTERSDRPYEKNNVFCLFFYIKACKHVLVETQNTSMNMKMSIIWDLKNILIFITISSRVHAFASRYPHRTANAGHVNVKFIEILVLIFQHCPPLQLLLA